MSVETNKQQQCVVVFAAGRATTDTELEEMLESGNPAIFTQGVSDWTFMYSGVVLLPF